MKPGIYEQLVTEELSRLLRGLDDDLVSREPLDPADSHEVLARHLATLVTRALRSVPAGSDKPLLAQVLLANRIVDRPEIPLSASAPGVRPGRNSPSAFSPLASDSRRAGRPANPSAA